ncbi:MAG: arsenate reductase ArsC [Gemmatimonadaceae bacterium]|nr:arsenate reductase ArsC [Gemmatimonadaceae bacterium]
MAYRILVLCTGNSARSQMAEALFATLGVARGAGRVEAESAGSRPAARINPYAVETLAAHGIIWRDRQPQSIQDVSGRSYDLVITVCDNARDVCPFFPGAGTQVHWGMPDPADHALPEDARRAFAESYNAIRDRVEALLALPLESLAPEQISESAMAIHRGRPVTPDLRFSP